jgi:hypothetical protein
LGQLVRLLSRSIHDPAGIASRRDRCGRDPSIQDTQHVLPIFHLIKASLSQVSVQLLLSNPLSLLPAPTVVTAIMPKASKAQREKSHKHRSSRERLVELNCYKVYKGKAKEGEEAAWERYATGGHYVLKLHAGSDFSTLEAEMRKGLQVDDDAVFHDARFLRIIVEKSRLVLPRREVAPNQGVVLDPAPTDESNQSSGSSADSDDSGSDTGSEEEGQLPGLPLCDVAAAAQRYISEQVRNLYCYS